jgi:hypothetical protein
VNFPNNKKVFYSNCVPALSFYKMVQTIRLMFEFSEFSFMISSEPENSTEVVRCHGNPMLSFEKSSIEGMTNQQIRISLALNFPGTFPNDLLYLSASSTVQGTFTLPSKLPATYSNLTNFLNSSFFFTPEIPSDGVISVTVSDSIQGNMYSSFVELKISI